MVTVPAGSVATVVAVAFKVVENALEVASVDPLASVSVPVVADIVIPFRLVAVATPSVGVTRVAPVANARTVPVPVVV